AVKCEGFFVRIEQASGFLHMNSDSYAGSFGRAWSQDRQLLDDDLEFGLAPQKRERISQGTFTEATIVIQEFNKRDVAERVAKVHLVSGRENCVCIGLYRRRIGLR